MKIIENMVVFLTGAAGSLGSATAKRLVKEGCKVALFDLPDSQGEKLSDKLGDAAMFFPGDVTSENDVQNALEVTKKELGNIKTVVNCAAVHKASEVFNSNKERSINMERFESLLKVNVTGTMNVIRLVSPYLRANPTDQSDLRGLVINTSGFAAWDGQMGQVGLAAAWGAIEAMTMPLCREFGHHGIRVMTISPGLMDSKLTASMSSKILESFAVLTPAPKRLGRREEYAELVMAIIKNSFLNGEVIRLSGGLRLTL